MGNTSQKIEPFTYQDYQKLLEGERLEIIDGVIYDMSPSSTVKHQKIVGNFFGLAHGFFKACWKPKLRVPSHSSAKNGEL